MVCESDRGFVKECSDVWKRQYLLTARPDLDLLKYHSPQGFSVVDLLMSGDAPVCAGSSPSVLSLDDLLLQGQIHTGGKWW